jgi:hypothetical protein
MDTPTINVNLAKCACGCPVFPNTHTADCPGKPVDIPLPLDAVRSVTFTVRLGECSTLALCEVRGGLLQNHAPQCPAHPIRVTCSISGKTWEESEVMETKYTPVDDVPRGADSWAPLRIADICRDRWALVKALLAEQARLEESLLGAVARTVAVLKSTKFTMTRVSDSERPSTKALGIFVRDIIQQVGDAS